MALRGVDLYFDVVTRDTVDSCMPMSLGDVTQDQAASGAKMPLSKNSRWKLQDRLGEP